MNDKKMSDEKVQKAQNNASVGDSARDRTTADEKMIKALIHQAMKDALGKRDAALLSAAQQMVRDTETK